MSDSKTLWVIIGIVALVAIAAVVMMSRMPVTSNQPPASGGQKACTMEAKVCPDGSSVGRSGPNCEFAACPTAVKVKVNY